jgi:hypothetical protein
MPLPAVSAITGSKSFKARRWRFIRDAAFAIKAMRLSLKSGAAIAGEPEKQFRPGRLPLQDLSGWHTHTTGVMKSAQNRIMHAFSPFNMQMIALILIRSRDQ